MKYKHLWIAKDSDGSIVITNCKPINDTKVKGKYNFVRDINKPKAKLIMVFKPEKAVLLFKTVALTKAGAMRQLHSLTIIPKD